MSIEPHHNDRNPAPLELTVFFFTHLNEQMKHVMMKMPDGALHWGYIFDVDTHERRKGLVRGVASMVTYFWKEYEIQVYKLHDEGKRALYYDDGHIDPTSALLRDGYPMSDSAPKLKLFIWDGDTTIYNGDGEPEYRLLHDDPRSRSIELAVYMNDVE